ncbi:hypothetical protein [Vibrio owensii]|uniref:hypothetical protein n=1 Tax=Vibrio owensii TaxID=696485 RepID=UPI0018F27629|nr:hypothetical protein [Vibrio owensii]
MKLPKGLSVVSLVLLLVAPANAGKLDIKKDTVGAGALRSIFTCHMADVTLGVGERSGLLVKAENLRQRMLSYRGKDRSDSQYESWREFVDFTYGYEFARAEQRFLLLRELKGKQSAVDEALHTQRRCARIKG